MTGTDGARVLAFARPVLPATSSTRTPMISGESSSARTLPTSGATSSARTFSINNTGAGFLGISQGRVWRPKVYVRNPNYPRVTAVGCFFVEHSGGYQL